MKRIGNGLTGFFISKGLISLKYTLRYVCNLNYQWVELDLMAWLLKNFRVN
jgi:hypothetical protein